MMAAILHGSQLSTVACLLLCLLGFTVLDVSAIYCYQCNSYTEPSCLKLQENDTMSTFYRECQRTPENEGQELFCRKTTQIILDPDIPHTRVIRACGWVRHPKKRDCYTFNNKGHEEESCTCYRDGCNLATATAPPVTLLVVLASFALLARPAILSLK